MKIQRLLTPFLLCLAVLAQAQSAPREEAAKKALQEYRQLAALQNFGNSEQITSKTLERATLGEPILHQAIGLNQLREYKSGADPKSIVQPVNRVTYPVLSDGAVLSSIELDQVNGKWQTAELGARTYVRLFEEVRKKAGLKSSEVSLVRVPGFNVYFLAVQQNGSMRFALLSEQAISDIPPQEFIPAQTAIERLVPAAKAYNGLPW